MDYVPLDTLAAVLTESEKVWAASSRQNTGRTRLRDRFRRRPHGRTHERISLAAKVGPALYKALHKLAEGKHLSELDQHTQHLDLSPSNILVRRDAKDEDEDEDAWSFRFIDLGRNNLYSRQVGIADHDDAVYVSTEVKNRSQSATSDVYSVAVILIEILTGLKPRDGIVPDAIYRMSPALGQVLEDSMDDDPRKRLLLAGRQDQITYASLARDLKETFELVSAEPVARDWAIFRLWATVAPASNEPLTAVAKLITLWRRRKVKKVPRKNVYLTLGNLPLGALLVLHLRRVRLISVQRHPQRPEDSSALG